MDALWYHRAAGPSATGNGPLQGIKIAVQSVFSAADWPTDAGSKALENYIAPEDATVVKRLCESGALIVGSTRTSEFGFGLTGGNAGKAIRERLADVELVLDMAGECRHAASRADLFGFKPSYGLISRFGVIGLIPSMESCGILSENIREIRTVLKVISGPDERDFSLPDKTPIDFSPVSIKPETTTIGIIREAISGLPESRAKRFRYAVDRFIKLGFPVKELALPDYGFFPLAHHIIGSVEASSCAGRYDSVRYGRRVPGAKNWNEMYLRSRGEAFGPLLKSYLLQGAFFQFERYESFENACRIRARLAGGMKHLFEHCDVMLFPELVHAYEEESVPPALPDLYSLMEMTLFANVTGQPALCLRNDDDSEFSGLQLAGARLDDARLLSLGEYIAAVGRGGNG